MDGVGRTYHDSVARSPLAPQMYPARRDDMDGGSGRHEAPRTLLGWACRAMAAHMGAQDSGDHAMQVFLDAADADAAMFGGVAVGKVHDKTL